MALPRKSLYRPSEVAKAIGDHRDVMRRRLLNGIYPEPKTKLGNGSRRFTAKEVQRLAEIKERIKLGIH